MGKKVFWFKTGKVNMVITFLFMVIFKSNELLVIPDKIGIFRKQYITSDIIVCVTQLPPARSRW